MEVVASPDVLAHLELKFRKALFKPLKLRLSNARSLFGQNALKLLANHLRKRHFALSCNLPYFKYKTSIQR